MHLTRVALFVMVAASLLTACLGARRVKVRAIPEETIPIVERLLPDDEVIELFEGADVGFIDYGRMSWEEWVGLCLRESELVVVAEVTSTTGQLSPPHFPFPAGSGVVTRLRGSVREVLVQGPSLPTISSGEVLNVYMGGGEVRVGHVVVRRGVKPGTPPLPVPQRYLMFLREHAEGRFFIMHGPLLIQNGKLSYVWSFQYPGNKRNPLQGKRLDQVARVIQKAQAGKR